MYLVRYSKNWGMVKFARCKFEWVFDSRNWRQAGTGLTHSIYWLAHHRGERAGSGQFKNGVRNAPFDFKMGLDPVFGEGR